MTWRILKAGPFCLLLCCFPFATPAAVEEKVYIAVEGEGTLAVFDTASRQILKRIDLAAESQGEPRKVTPHNVQVAADGGTVWVTANAVHAAHGAASSEEHHGDQGHAAMEPPFDEVLVVDPASDTVIRRIPLGPGLHLAHVVLAPDGSRAFVTAQNESAIYEIDAREYRVVRKIEAPPRSQPHGLRMAPDGGRAYVALLGGKSLGILDVASGRLQALPLDGAPVQTAVTPDGKRVLATLYDTRKLAVYQPATASLRYIDLLGAARGPVQLYPTPDGRYVYVADQGHYFGQPDSEWVYKVDLEKSRTIWAIQGGKAPHGIVVSPDGRTAYVTNLVSDDLSVIDLESDREVMRVPVGHEPNGVSIWNRRTGGTP
jgi:YVTN family beta-propeller protein